MNHTRTTTLLVGAAAIVIVVAGLRSAADIVGPLMLALALTIVFHPLRQKLERRLPGWAASVALLICVYVLILALTLALVVSVGRLGELVSAYGQEADDFVAQIADGLEASGMGSEQVDAVAEALDVGQLVDLTTTLLSSVLSVLSDLFFLVTLLLFLAFDSAHVSRLADDARRHRPHLVAALSTFARGTRTYLGVSAVFGLIVAVIDTVLLWAMGIPGAFVWGVLAFVTNFIPNIGFVIGLVPPALIGLLEGGPGPDARRDRRLLGGQRDHPVGHPAPLRRQRGRPVDHAHVPVPGVLDLGARSPGCPARGADEPVLQGDPRGGRPGAQWLEPVISGHPRDETPVEPPSVNAREPRSSADTGATDRSVTPRLSLTAALTPASPRGFPRTQGAHAEREQPRQQRDQDGGDHGPEESTDLERIGEPGGERQQGTVDDEGEEAERHHGDGQRDQAQERARPARSRARTGAPRPGARALHRRSRPRAPRQPRSRWRRP